MPIGRLFRTGSSRANRVAERNAKELREYSRGLQESTTFNPIGVTTGFGDFRYDPETGYSSNVNRSPEEMALQEQLLSNSSRLLDQASLDPSQRANEIYQQQVDMLQPEFQRQQAALQQNLFGSGRLGLQLSGGLVGAGAGTGMVNPDAFGYNQALGQTLAGISAGAREQSLAEQSTLANIGRGLFDANRTLADSFADRELALLQLGIDAEAKRQAGNISSGQLGLGGYQTASEMQNRALRESANRRSGMLSGLLSGAATLGTAGVSGGGSVFGNLFG